MPRKRIRPEPTPFPATWNPRPPPSPLPTPLPSPCFSAAPKGQSTLHPINEATSEPEARRPELESNPADLLAAPEPQVKSPLHPRPPLVGEIRTAPPGPPRRIAPPTAMRLSFHAPRMCNPGHSRLMIRFVRGWKCPWGAWALVPGDCGSSV
jgi:hypothetical protein